MYFNWYNIFSVDVSNILCLHLLKKLFTHVSESSIYSSTNEISTARCGYDNIDFPISCELPGEITVQFEK